MTEQLHLTTLRNSIRCIPDFPKPGINFRDITTLLEDANALRLSIDSLTNICRQYNVDWIAGIEARGFIFGTAVAYNLGISFLPVRKAGKLPAATLNERYQLEYGDDQLEIHANTITPGQRVIVIDDLLATGGTACATVNLLNKAGADVVAAAFVIELDGLPGRTSLHKKACNVYSLCNFPA